MPADIQVPPDFFYTCNGRLVSDLSQLPKNASVQVHYRLRGGKGGFGSMLRAIGSQIEKTTNHEMCRDLSGRRMRDVNMERKLKEWYAKASEREREKMEKYYERRRKRQEMLAEGPLPGHKFSDRQYERQKRKITHELQSALDTAIEKILREESNGAGPSSSGAREPKRSRLWIEKLDGETSSSSSSDHTADEGNEEIFPDSAASSTDEMSKHPEVVCSVLPDTTESLLPPSIDSVADDKSEVTELPEVPTERKPSATSLDEQPSTTKPLVIPLTDSELMAAEDAHSLELYGLDTLKESLTARGLKCGGTLQERAARLFSVRGLQPEEYPTKLRAKTK